MTLATSLRNLLFRL